MDHSNTLIVRLADQELNGDIRSIVKSIFDRRAKPENILLREFEFNCFEIFLDFKKALSRCKMFLPAEKIALLIYRRYESFLFAA